MNIFEVEVALLINLWHGVDFSLKHYTDQPKTTGLKLSMKYVLMRNKLLPFKAMIMNNM